MTQSFGVLAPTFHKNRHTFSLQGTSHGCFGYLECKYQSGPWNYQCFHYGAVHLVNSLDNHSIHVIGFWNLLISQVKHTFLFFLYILFMNRGFKLTGMFERFSKQNDRNLKCDH